MTRLAFPMAFAAAVFVGGSAQAQFKTPEDGVRALYASYEGKDAKGFDSGSAKTLRRFFTPDLVKLWRRAKQVDADFFIQGQDFEIADLKVGNAAITGDKATLDAAFTNFKTPMKLTYSLAKSADGWRISDAKSGKDTLRAMLRQSR